MQKFMILLIFVFTMAFSLTAIGQTPDDAEATNRAEALSMSEEFARTRDMEAQDKIIDPNEYLIGPGDELTVFFQGAIVSFSCLSSSVSFIASYPKRYIFASSSDACMVNPPA